MYSQRVYTTALETLSGHAGCFFLPPSQAVIKQQKISTVIQISFFFPVCVCLIFFFIKHSDFKNFCGCLWDAEILLLHQHTVISRLNPLQKAQDSCGD